SVPRLGANGSALSQQVSSTGTVTPPMLDSFDVRGLTTEQASEAITRKYRDARLIPEDAAAQVTLAPAAPVGQRVAHTVATPITVAANSPPNDVKKESEKEAQQVQQ